MAYYDYKCSKCDFIKEVSHGMNETPQVLCELCGETMSKMIPKNLNFMLKGASWTGKNIKEKSYRSSRNRELGKKMALSHDIPQICPNYKGNICSNWEEAKKIAKEDGVNPLVYEKQVQNLEKEQKRVNEKREKLIKGEE